MAQRPIPENTLIPSKAPNLLTAPRAYDPLYQELLNNALRIYFNQLDALNSALFAVGGGERVRDGIGGGKYLRFPFGAFQDSTDQTTTANTATVVTINTTDLSNGVTVESGSQITVKEGGVYNLQFSIQYINTDSQDHDVSLWFRLNGTNIANSNTELTIPSRHGSVDGRQVAAWNFVLALAAGDYVQLYWSTDNAAVSIQQIPAQTVPTRPATPSVILTVTFVSGLTS